MYEARGREIWVLGALGAPDELFLTLHETEPVHNSITTLEEQARILAKILNEA